jgi:dihydrolipoamide dehydrogenase
MTESQCDVVVIGAGPGGYACAARAGQLGLRTVVVDGGPLGGTCLNVGCIPSKALIHAAGQYGSLADAGATELGIAARDLTIDLAATVAWKDGVVGRLRGGVQQLLDGAKARRVAGFASIRDGKSVTIETADGTEVLHTRALVIATGSVPVELPGLPFGGAVISSTEALSLTEVPDRLLIVGAGYIGLELGTAYRKLGAAVTVVEAEERILPRYDAALTAPVAARLGELGVDLSLQTQASGWNGQALIVSGPDGTERSLPAELVLVTVGRRPAIDGFGLEALELAMDGRAVRVDDRCRTSMSGVFAIGDVTGEPMLAHRATAQGEMVAEVIAGRRRAWDDRVVPEICYTDPEIVSAGMSPDDATAAGIDHVVGRATFGANARALTLQRADGFARVVAARDDGRILGVQLVGGEVAELAAACCALLEMGATVHDVRLVVHAHPTLSEAMHEAATKAVNRLAR